MAQNLRNQGYPQSRSTQSRWYKRDAVMNNLTPTPFYSGSTDLGMSMSSPNEKGLDRMIAAYNNKAFGNPNAPLISKTGYDYISDDNDERSYLSGYQLRNHNGDRLGFINRDTSPGRTSYNVGIDNLPFGEQMYDKTFDTPIGSFNANYDGDGTATVSYDMSPNVYYITALAKALMSRGSL